MARSRFKKTKGQSLVELLIALTVGIILIGSAATLIAVTLRSSTYNKYVQPALQLGQDLLDKVTVFSETQWNCPPASPVGACSSGNLGIYNLTKGEANHYYLSTSTPPGLFTWQVGEAIRNFEGVTYNSYFYLENVCRNPFTGEIGSVTSSAVCVSEIEDPSAQKITAVVSWQQGGQNQQIQVSKFLTRNQNRVFVQTDWSGGTTVNEVVTIPNSKFHSATPNINYTGTPGSIYVQ